MLSRASSRNLARSTGRTLLQFRFCSAASVEAVPTTAADQPAKLKPKKSKLQAKESKFDWTYVVGMTRYASRRDLEMLLGSFKPTKIEPMLSLTHVFSGAYGFKFATPEEHVEFRKFISNNDLNKTKAMSLKVFEDSWFDNKKLLHASTVDVTNRTVWCQVGNQSVTVEHIVSFFEDYDLKHENIKRYFGASGSAKPHYLLHFRSPEEAERAAIENDKKPFIRDIISLETYPC